MRLPSTAHTSRPWRIHEIAPGFRLEDVWALPTPGGPGDFPELVRVLSSFDPGRHAGAPVGALFALRRVAGALLGVDRPGTGLGARVPSLRDRLPADLRGAPAGPANRVGGFTPLYLTADEWALEVANGTVHGVLHVGWVPDGAGRHRGQMAVLVRPNGRLGECYLAAIAPARHRIVYPALLRGVGAAWARGSRPAAEACEVRRVAVPPDARALSTLRRVDYADAFLVEAGPQAERTAEQWARAVLEDAPAPVRHTLQTGWARLGLRLDRSPGSVLGWTVRRRTPDVLLLGAPSRIGMPGELLFRREGDALLFATFVQHDNPVARGLWAGVEPVHVQVVRRILREAARRPATGGGSPARPPAPAPPASPTRSAGARARRDRSPSRR